MCEGKTAGGIDRHKKRTFRWFLHETDGFAIILTIISFPFFLAIAAWVIDASRVSNLHTDLYNAVDAMALSGARELDGRDDAIPRAQNAIAGLNSNIALFADGGGNLSMGSRVNMVYNPADAATSTVTVRFLKSLPASDDEPIDFATHEVSGTAVQQSNEARYAYVVSKNQSMQTIFPFAFTGQQTLDVAAEAVATYTAAACDVTPIYICNPFEGSTLPGSPDIHVQFAAGNLYSRQYIMDLKEPPGPGNFGFLQTFGTGANVLAEALATGFPGVCIQEGGVDTKPGQNVGPVDAGINIRMGIYQPPFQNNNNKPAWRPDMNVRKGNVQPVDCRNYDPELNILDAMPFPEGGSVVPMGGGSFSSADWDLDFYWDITHGTHVIPPAQQVAPTYLDNPANPPPAPPSVYSYMPSLPPGLPAPPNPSRYDVFLYEIANPVSAPAPTSLNYDPAPNAETGEPTCQGPTATPDLEDRRVIFAAIIDCLANAPINGQTNIPTIAFARLFMTKPAVFQGSVKNIFLEVIDITGSGGLGTVELLLREEAELVR